jgi:hypothetical protein
MSTTHDLVASLARARQWVRARDLSREVSIKIVDDHVQCALIEARYTDGGARRVAGISDGGEHYDDPAAELAHAIDAALERAGER